jgi:uncharacterized protein (DUF1778 family)
MAPKDARVAVRMTSEQEALIKQASEVEGTTVTEFTVSATVAHARDVLADRRLFSVSPSAFTEFLAALDRPVTHKPALAKLLNDSPIFEDED